MNILKYLLIACSCLIGAAHAQSPIAKDTIEYRAQVWVDKTDLERYGGEEDFKKNLKRCFIILRVFGMKVLINSVIISLCSC